MTKTSSLTDTYLKYRSKLMRAVSAIVSPDDIEDIVQEAYIKSYEAELNQEIEFQRSYMLRTVRNLALNYVTSAAQQLNDAVEDMDTLPYDLIGYSLDNDVESKERFVHFCRATETLSVDVKRVFLLKKVYGMKQKDIAELLELSESTVEKHVAKGLLMCSRYLANLSQAAEPSGSQRPNQGVRSQ